MSGESWGGLGAVLRRLMASWGVLGRLGASWGGLGAVLGRSLGVWGSQDLREYGLGVVMCLFPGLIATYKQTC